jgi:hypothetical protein
MAKRAKKKTAKGGARKKVDVRKARVRDLGSGDVTGGASGFSGGGFSGFSGTVKKTS